MSRLRIALIILFIPSFIAAATPGENRINDARNQIDNAANSTTTTVSQSTTTTIQTGSYINQSYNYSVTTTTTTLYYHPHPDGHHPIPGGGGRKHRYHNSDSSIEHEETLGESVMGFLFKSLWYAFSKSRFTDYPYEPDQIAHSIYPPMYRYVIDDDRADDFLDNSSVFSFHSDINAAYLLYDTYGVFWRSSLNISGFYMNLMYQYIFSGSASLSLMAQNFGLSLTFADFMLTGYLGYAFTDMTMPLFFSRGVELTAFFPAKVAFHALYSRYSVNAASIDYADFTIDVSFSRFQIGAGAVYENFSGVEFYGPIVKVSIWL